MSSLVFCPDFHNASVHRARNTIVLCCSPAGKVSALLTKLLSHSRIDYRDPAGHFLGLVTGHELPTAAALNLPASSFATF